MSNNIEEKLNLFMRGLGEKEVEAIANLKELEQSYMKVRWEVLSYLVPHLVFVKDFTLILALDESLEVLPYFFNKRTTKELVINYEDYQVEYVCVENDRVGVADLTDMDYILLTDNSTGEEYDLCDLLSLLTRERSDCVSLVSCSNVVNVKFKK